MKILKTLLNRAIALYRFLRARPVIFLLFLLAAVLVLNFLIKHNEKKEKATQTLAYPEEEMLLSQEISSSEAKLSIDPNVSVPKEIRTYKITYPERSKTRLFFDQAAKSLGATAAAEMTRENSPAYQIAGTSGVFAGNLSTGAFSFTGSGARLFDDKRSGDFKKDALRLVSSWIPPEIKIAEPAIEFYKEDGSEFDLVLEEKSANLYGYVFRPTINGIPLYQATGLGPSLRLLINKNTGEIRRADFGVVQIDKNKSLVIPALSIKEILSSAVSGARFVSFVDKKGANIANFETKDFNQISIGKINLIYGVSAARTEFLLPFYVLEGSSTTKGGLSGHLTLLLPATQTAGGPGGP